MTEKDFLGQVRELLTEYGWLEYHTHDSRRSPAGFPDIVAVRGGRMLALELKMPKGRLTGPQRRWLEELDKVPGCYAAVLWWHSDLGAFVELIR